MKILTPNHKYELANFEHPEKPGQVIQFIEKTYALGSKEAAQTLNDGTTNEEVLKMIINRMIGLNQKVPSRQSSIAITKLQESLMWLNNRTEERKHRGVEGTMKP